MNSRPKEPKYTRNKNTLVVGGSVQVDEILYQTESPSDAFIIRSYGSERNSGERSRECSCEERISDEDF